MSHGCRRSPRSRVQISREAEASWKIASVDAPRLPRGYLGIAHETLGSDIIAFLKVIKLPEDVLGKEFLGRLKGVKADQWYPIETILEMGERVDAKYGSPSLVSIGWSIFKLSHEQNARKAFKSAREILYAMDAMYRTSNRGGSIGGWKVVSFDLGMAVMEKNTPHHCSLEQGILEKALLSVGVPSQVTQTQCFREGAATCRFMITSPVVDARWNGASKAPVS